MKNEGENLYNKGDGKTRAVREWLREQEPLSGWDAVQTSRFIALKIRAQEQQHPDQVLDTMGYNGPEKRCQAYKWVKRGDFQIHEKRR